MYAYSEPLGKMYTEDDIVQSIDAYYDFAINTYNILIADMYKDVDWMNTDIRISAEFKRFNGTDLATFGSYEGGVITLYLYSIMKRVRMNMVCTIIVSTLVHELKHAGQCVFRRDEFDCEQSYINHIERPVEWETLQYLSEKREWLEDQLGVSINLIAFKRMQLKYGVYNTSLYEPTNPQTYWISILKFIYGYNSKLVIHIIENDVLNKENSIVLYIINNEGANRRFYNCAQYIKKDGVFYFPDSDFIELGGNLGDIKDIGITVETGWNDDGVYIMETSYKIGHNSPIIKYDKPCTT